MDNNGNDNNNNNNWRPAQADRPPNMDPSADWRNQLQSDSRQHIVNKIMETLKRHLPFSGQDGWQELWRIAVRFEENIYSAATSQADYLRKISLKMLTRETKSQNTIASNLSANAVGNSRNLADSASLDSTAQTGHMNGGDWQDEVFQKIKSMKEMYFPEINEMYQKITLKLQQLDSMPQLPKTDRLDKFRMFKTMLDRIINFLQVQKANVTPYHKDKMGSYEKQIQSVLNTNRPRRSGPPVQQNQLPSSHLQSIQQSQQAQSQITHMQPHENQMNPPMQSGNLQGSVASMQQNNMTGLHGARSSLSEVSNAQQNVMNSVQPGEANVIKDWRDELYVKIKATKDKYLPQIQQIRQKIVNGLQEHDANPRRENVQHMRRLRLARTALDQIILFLNVQKATISFNHSVLLGRHQRKIRHILDLYNPERPIPYVPYAGFCSKYRSTVRRRR